LRVSAHLFLLLTALSLTSAAGAYAAEPFDSLEVGVLAVADVSNTEYHEFWQHGRGAEIFAQTPFYSGSMRLGLRYLTNDRQPDETVPDSRSLYVYLGWSMIEFEVWRDRLITELGLGVGVNQWRFDETQTGNNQELEAATEIYGRARFVFAGSWSVNTTLRYQTTYTRTTINIVYVTLGVSRAFGMPGWLKGFLE
jgi:hypothetical protein